MLVYSKIISNLDYCNATYYGLPAYTINKLQRVQNCATRLVWKNKIPFNSSLDAIYESFSWLRVRFRIIYKILLIVHHCLHENAPTQVAAMIQFSQSQRTMKLQETRTLSSYGDRAFSHVGPKLWNLLPGEIRIQHDLISFKQKLKSFLMTRGEEFVAWTSMRWCSLVVLLWSLMGTRGVAWIVNWLIVVECSVDCTKWLCLLNFTDFNMFLNGF